MVYKYRLQDCLDFLRIVPWDSSPWSIGQFLTSTPFFSKKGGEHVVKKNSDMTYIRIPYERLEVSHPQYKELIDPGSYDIIYIFPEPMTA